MKSQKKKNNNRARIAKPDQNPINIYQKTCILHDEFRQGKKAKTLMCS